MAKSDTGVWRDKRTGKIVTTQPVAGYQLVAPGGDVPAELVDHLPDKKAKVEKKAEPAAETAARKPAPEQAKAQPKKRTRRG